MSRAQHLDRFYDLLDTLEGKLGGARTLEHSDGQMTWPQRGVYFFMEDGEDRSNQKRKRIVRVGINAKHATSRTTLWTRLRQHRGNKNTGGNHGASIFRLLVGTALITRDSLDCPSWGEKDQPCKPLFVEQQVSEAIGKMPFLWLEVDDGHEGRSYIESNTIALLSNLGKPAIDPPSADWLGHHCQRPKVQKSGLWNQQKTDKPYNPSFLDDFARLVGQMRI